MKNHSHSVKLRITLLLLTLILSISAVSCVGNTINPSDKTGSYTISTPSGTTPEPSNQELTYTDITLLSAGDIMYHMPQVNSAYRDGKYSFSDNFQYVKNIISAADYAVVNFETTLANQTKYTSYPTFNSPLATLDSIREAGFDMLLFANNHCYDYKKPGFLSTLGHFQEYGFDFIGGKTDSSAK